MDSRAAVDIFQMHILDKNNIFITFRILYDLQIDSHILILLEYVWLSYMILEQSDFRFLIVT